MTLTHAASSRDALLERSRPALERLARRLVWDPEDARDVVQAAYLDALASWHTLSDIAALDGWLRRIVVNRAWSTLRRRRLWKAVGAVLFVPEAELAPGPDDAAEQAQHRRALAAALEQLSAKQALAFSLRYLEGLSIDEVAEAMAIDRGTVRVHLQRAVAALRAKGALS